MQRADKSRFVLYIEPKSKDKLKMPVHDVFTFIMKKALDESERGTANYSDLSSNGKFYPGKAWRGYHETECGQRCNGCDYLLKNGMITNSLAVFYLKYYRRCIPASEMNKVIRLYLFYAFGRNQKPVSVIFEHNPIRFWILRIRFKMVSWGIPSQGIQIPYQLDWVDDEDDQLMW